MEYHVSKAGTLNGAGTQESPFLTIGQAAAAALPGDRVIVHAGLYREWVDPANGGTEDAPIVYESAGDGEAIIAGSEEVTGWKLFEGDVYTVTVDNTVFFPRNPFATDLAGDWLFKEGFGLHLGAVYQDGAELYESRTLDGVRKPERFETSIYPEEGLKRWYAEVSEDTTTIYANFGGDDPNASFTEISARPYCFWPSKLFVNYIVVRGFTLRQAATQWAPPTALQEGIIGPHWAKGWVIENNTIRDSKCCGISLGKEEFTGNNEWTVNGIKGGTQREQEVIFRALHYQHWDREHVGSHLIRNNHIFNCEQAGIVGHLGGAFSVIENNKIHDIHVRQLYHGAEVSGIKLHASIDVQIRRNLIFRSYRGVWLDWQAQGTRISSNVFYGNLSEDFFVEVCHGPYMADHNLFLSSMNYRDLSDGGAFVHNLFAGRIIARSEPFRQTPYHFPHDTAVAGYASFPSGDDRFCNNIFLRTGDNDGNEPKPWGFFEHYPRPVRTPEEEEAFRIEEEKRKMDGLPSATDCLLYPVGTGAYNGYPEKTSTDLAGPKDFRSPLPVFLKGNVYLGGALPADIEPSAKCFDEPGISFTILDDDRVEVVYHRPEDLMNCGSLIDTACLGKSYNAEMNYENPDGTPYLFSSDFFGHARPANPTAGPFEAESGTELKFTVG